MKGLQFPLVSNSATTGHKLQGCTVDSILVNDWWYQQNWPYVVLSRVKTMDGLYIGEKLSFDLKKYAMNNKMLKMLEGFHEQCMIEPISNEEYETLIRDTEPTTQQQSGMDTS